MATRQAFDASLRAAQTKLDALRPYMKQFSVNAVGNSHIDMAWLWPETETVEVVRNTFGTALDLMREYPDFKFTASTAQAYTWIEEKYPAMFQRDPAARERRPLGGHRRHVGRARPQHARRRIAGAADLFTASATSSRSSAWT